MSAKTYDDLRPKDNCPKCGATGRQAFGGGPRYGGAERADYLVWSCQTCSYIRMTPTVDAKKPKEHKEH